jgi:NodT family efflux transporter outer membrane factor (OMF) lipoprotein
MLEQTYITADTMRKIRLFVRFSACIGLTTAAMLSACTVGPDFVRPTPPAVDRYTSEQPVIATIAADGQTQNFKLGASIQADWWRLFKSSQLNAMVQQAIANNPTLAASEATLRQSQDNLRAGEGIFYPQANAGLAAERARNAPIQQGSSIPGTVFNLVTASASVGYILDIFGGERRAVEGLRAQTDAQRYATKAAYLTLSANVVNTSIARAAYAAQILATKQLITMETEQLHATEAQVRAGTSSYASELSIRSQIASSQASLAPLKQRVDQTEHLLATLEGVEPSKASLPNIELAGLTLPTDLPVSFPSELVRQRPDILQAEAQLHLASADIGIATAAMYPSFSLNATYGAAGSSFSNMTKASGRFWSIGPEATVPLFRGGSLKYAKEAAIDAYHASQANYRQAVLSAFAQVADSLKALEHDAESLQAQAEAKRTAEEALKLLQANYHAGLVAYLDVLTADIQYHQANIAYLQAVAQRQQDTVALFVALGGGWWNEEPALNEGKAP